MKIFSLHHFTIVKRHILGTRSTFMGCMILEQISYFLLNSYFGFNDLSFMDIESNGQNLQQPTHFAYISVTTDVRLILNNNVKLLYYSVYIHCTGILYCQIR